MVIEGMISHRAGREPAQHRSEAAGLPALGRLMAPPSQTRRARQPRSVGDSLRRSDHAAARVLRRDVRDVLGQRGQVPRALRFAGRRVPWRAAHARADPGRREAGRAPAPTSTISIVQQPMLDGQPRACSIAADRRWRSARRAAMPIRCRRSSASELASVADEVEQAMSDLIDRELDRRCAGTACGSKSRSAPTFCSRAASRRCRRRPSRFCSSSRRR